jgi:S-(hydroxymethyl)glutathione dehydrogenase/alcohol dehydrogenase
MRAAVVRETDRLGVETVLLGGPHEREVLVRIHAAGICHSDLHTLQGQLRATPPLVLGHEGAGVVVEIGSQVRSVAVGDRVMVNWMPACRQCSQCLEGRSYLCERLPSTTFSALLPDGSTRLRTQEGMALKHFLSSATFAEYAVLDEAGVIPIPADVPYEVAAVMGCAVVTGVGAVVNTAQAKAGRSAAVIGCGGVGLSVILGCVLAGLHPIVAVDTQANKLNFARELGATHTLHAVPGVHVADEIKSMVRGGVEYAFDSVGAATTIGAALDSARPGGSAVVMGLHGIKQPAAINPASLIYQNRRLLGSFFGSSSPFVDLPRLIELYRAGRLPVERLISARYNLNGINHAFADLEAGRLARGVVVL